MRLTLRTLLAFMDDILDPSASQELSDKIKGSEYASALVHRIRNGISRHRLASPKVLGKGMAADPNSVAEYLDNTLAVERVPEFEKVCLESDMHLAEVASCHQIVTLVIVGSPADVTDRLRQRAYHVDQDTRVTAAPVTRTAQDRRRIDQAIRPLEDEQLTTTRPQASLSDPTESTDRTMPRLIPIAAMLLIGFVATSLVLFATGWLTRSPRQLAENNNAQPPVVESGEAAVAAAPDWPAERTPENPQLPLAGGTDDDMSRSGAAANGAPADNMTESSATPAVPAGPSGDGRPGGPAVEPPGQAAPTTATDRSVAMPSPNSDSPAMSGDEASPAVDGGSNQPAPSIDQAAEAIGSSNLIPGEDAISAAPPIEPEEPRTLPRDIGRKIGDHQVLAIWNPEQQAWIRMADRASIEVGQRLRALPTFRPHLLLSNGIQLTLADQIDLGISESTTDGSPTLDITNGRAIFSGLGQDAGQVVLRCGAREILIRQGDPQSEFAVAVERILPHGADPTAVERNMLIQIWALNRTIGIAEADEPTRAVRAGEVWTAKDQYAASIMVADEQPEWAVTHDLREIDRTALRELEPKLSEDRSLTLTLHEISEGRRTDVKSLAARCLAALDRFEPTLEALGDRRQHPHWTMLYHQLTSAVSRDPRVSERLRETLKRTNGPDAEKMYRMLWGYSSEQLDAGGAAELVEHLEDESLEVRVLAIETLKRITGMHLYYKPEQPLARRQSAIKNWQKRLDAGGIRHKSEPAVE